MLGCCSLRTSVGCVPRRCLPLSTTPWLKLNASHKDCHSDEEFNASSSEESGDDIDSESHGSSLEESDDMDSESDSEV